MKIVIAGGTGFLGSLIIDHFKIENDIVVLTRNPREGSHGKRFVKWDGSTVDGWAAELYDADVLINLTGKSVNCRYNRRNRAEILHSRVDSVNALSEAMHRIGRDIPVWIQSSSATIYRHAIDQPMTEAGGEIGSGFSVDVCNAWEKAFTQAHHPQTRKIVLRTGVVFGGKGGAFPMMRRLAGLMLGGRMGDGKQLISWLHEKDFVRIIAWLISNPGATGIYNCTSPSPVTNEVCMHEISRSVGAKLRINSPEWMLAAGGRVIGTETELVLKSRWVLPERLVSEGFRFKYDKIRIAVENLTRNK